MPRREIIPNADAPYKVGERVRVSMDTSPQWPKRWRRGTVVNCELSQSFWADHINVTVRLDGGGLWGIWTHEDPPCIYRLDHLEQLAEACD